MSTAAILALVIPLALALWAAGSMLPLFTARLHPGRILTIALGIGSLLLIASLALSLEGITGIIWWLLLLGTAVGVVIACLRADRDRSRRVPAASFADAASADGPIAPAAVRVPAPSRRRERSRTRRLALARRPSWITLVSEAVLFLALLVLGLWAG